MRAARSPTGRQTGLIASRMRRSARREARVRPWRAQTRSSSAPAQSDPGAALAATRGGTAWPELVCRVRAMDRDPGRTTSSWDLAWEARHNKLRRRPAETPLRRELSRIFRNWFGSRLGSFHFSGPLSQAL